MIQPELEGSTQGYLLVSVEVLRYDKSSKSENMGIVLTEMELILEHTQKALKDNLRKLKGKAVVDEAVILHPIDPELLKIDVVPLAPKLQNNRTARYDYLKRTQEETVILVKHERLLNLLNTSLDYAWDKLMVVTPMNKTKRVRFTEPVTSSENKNIKIGSSLNVVSNKPMLSSTGVNLSTSASGSQPSGNTKKDKIQQTPSSSKKNKLEAHPRNVRSSLNKKNCVVKTKNTASVQNSKSNVNSDHQCVTCYGCLFSNNYDSCDLDFIYNVNARVKSKSVKKTVKRKIWKPTGKVGISHETSVACSLQQNDVVKRCNRTLIEATRTMLIYARAPLFLWAEAVATACFTQNRSIIHVHHEKTPYELLHETLPDLSYFHVFGALYYPTNDSENLGKLQPKVDIGPALDEMTPTTISSSYVPKPTSSTSVDHPTPEVTTPVAEVVTLKPAESTGSPSSTTVDQDASSPSKTQTTSKTQPPVIPNDVEEDNHDIKVAHMGNDPFFSMLIPEVSSNQSLLTDSIHTIVFPDHQISHYNSKWTKDHPLENIIGQLARPISIRLQLHEQALFCYYKAFLSSIKPKMYKDALTQYCWIEAMQEELSKFDRLKVWELLPRPDKVMVITLKWIYKV
nr:integrase, catalytic region, zinc finger, CCHC-type, peptidase aspartic, catalytic [Tanacetum cinerariifolium]